MTAFDSTLFDVGRLGRRHQKSIVAVPLPVMQSAYSFSTTNRMAVSTTTWEAYGTRDWVLIALSIFVLIAYEGFFLLVLHLSPHHCTLRRNIVSRKYAHSHLLSLYKD